MAHGFGGSIHHGLEPFAVVFAEVGFLSSCCMIIAASAAVAETPAFEQNLRNFMPHRMAFDMRLMSERFLSDGIIPEEGDVERLATLLSRPLRSYRDFAAEIAASA